MQDAPVRVLFTFAGGAGHSEPLVPIARAAQAAGHEVAFAGRPWVVAKLQARGFAGFPDEEDPVEPLDEVKPLLKYDPERISNSNDEGAAPGARGAGGPAWCSHGAPAGGRTRLSATRSTSAR